MLLNEEKKKKKKKIEKRVDKKQTQNLTPKRRKTRHTPWMYKITIGKQNSLWMYKITKNLATKTQQKAPRSIAQWRGRK